MSAIKERLFGAVTGMSHEDAEKVWQSVLNNFSTKSREDIEEVSPDEWYVTMLNDIANNPDCHEFVSQEDALKELGLK